MRVAGGTDREGGGDGPAIVLCHGFGAPGDDLVSLHRVIGAPKGTRFFFPEAPLAVDLGFGMQGRAWWMIDMARLQAGFSRGGAPGFPVDDEPAGLEAAAAALDGCVAALIEKERLDPARTVIGGFSQGAMITTDMVARGKRTFAGLVVLSGALLARPRWQASFADHGRGVAVLQSHGRRDPVLPYAVGEQLRDLLTANGAAVEFIGHGGQHEIPMPVVDALGRFCTQRLA